MAEPTTRSYADELEAAARRCNAGYWGFKYGAAWERQRIVAWLRANGAEGLGGGYRDAADDIEREAGGGP